MVMGHRLWVPGRKGAVHMSELRASGPRDPGMALPKSAKHQSNPIQSMDPPKGASDQQLVGGLVGVQNRGVAPPPPPVSCIFCSCAVPNLLAAGIPPDIFAAHFPRLQFSLDSKRQCCPHCCQFQEFIARRRFITDAEFYTWSFVFEDFLSREMLESDPARVQAAPWWRAIEGASWAHPEGKGSDVRDRADHPVVHVSWRDAYYYCRWKGGRLPTEAEWERAARGGLTGKVFPWGDVLQPNGEHMMNVFQGRQRVRRRSHKFNNTGADGHIGTAPVASFPPNGYGLYDMTGNVWEWTATEFRGQSQPIYARAGPPREDMTPVNLHMVKKGGSYLCHADHCNRYRCAARQGLEMDSSTGNIGFRCAYPYADTGEGG